MTRNVAVKFWRKHLKIVTCGAGDGILLNPALDFTSQAKCGEFDSIPDDEYKKMLDDCEDVASFWQNQPTASATMVLINALSKTPLPEKSLQKIADTLAACSEDCCYALRTQDDDVSYDDDEWYEQIDGDLDNKKPLSSWTPKEIYDALCQQVHGQDDAKRAAAMVMHGNLHGRRSNAVFCGPSGCGKSEIWRVLSHKFPGRIRMIDASRLSADGWTGSVHLRDIFTGISPLTIKRRGLIVVLDEADKVCCETIISGSGTDHSALVQNGLLKMMDGDMIEFGAENKQEAFTVDCSKVSVVMLGAFEKLLSRRTTGTGCIGFGGTPKVESDYSNTSISHDDLISAGMRREIAGRINRITSLRPLSVHDYQTVLCENILADIGKEMGCNITIDDPSASVLAQRASGTGLGVRWMRSQVRNAVEDIMFEDPDFREIQLLTISKDESIVAAFRNDGSL